MISFNCRVFAQSTIKIIHYREKDNIPEKRGKKEGKFEDDIVTKDGKHCSH